MILDLFIYIIQFYINQNTFLPGFIIRKELIKEKAQEDQEIRCARRMGMEATMNDAVRIANNTAPSDSKTKNIRKNRKEESITFMESNTIGSRLNTEETPPMIPMNDIEPEVLAEPEPQNNSEIVSFDEALAKIDVSI